MMLGEARWAAHRRTVAWAAAVILGFFVLLLPALVNGFPFVFADTGGYLARPFERTPALGRSALYGLFLAAGIPFEFWPNIIAQAGLTLWVLHVLLRVYGYRGPLIFVALIIGLSIFTSLPWFVGQLMPDVFVPLTVIALHLLAFARDRISGIETLLLLTIVALAMAAHMSIVGIVLGLLLLLAMLRLLHLRLGLARPLLVHVPQQSLPSGLTRGWEPLRKRTCTNKEPERNDDAKRSHPALGAPITAAAIGMLLALGSNFVITGQFTLTPGGSTFLFGRLLQDGIVARYLGEHCPDQEIRLCAFRNELPAGIDDWLWGDSPIGALGGWEAFEPESRRIVYRTLAAYPLLHIRTAARATGKQLITLATGEGLGSNDNWHVRDALRQYAPGTMAAFAASRQEHDAFDFRIVNFIHVPVALIATAMLPVIAVLCWRRNRELSLFAVTVLVAILANAAICGIFSTPNARYQARIVPLAGLTALMLLVSRLTAGIDRQLLPPAARPAEQPTTPARCGAIHAPDRPGAE
jgi:hypothetical protein